MKKITGAGWIAGIIVWIIIMIFSSTQVECLKFHTCGAGDMILFAVCGIGFIAPAWIVATLVSEIFKLKEVKQMEKPRSKRWSSFIFIMVIVMALVKFLFAFAYEDVGGHIAQALITLLGGIILLVIPAYFLGMLVDKFKKENQNIVLGVQQASPKVVETDIINHTKSNNLTAKNNMSKNLIQKIETQKITSTVESKDDFYAQAWDEINDQNKTPDKALWAKSFADAQGNDARTKANYLKLRVAQLSKENEQNILMERERQIKLMRKESLESEDQHYSRDDWESRTLCGDGRCTGIIGNDGHCTECGKTLEETSKDRNTTRNYTRQDNSLDDDKSTDWDNRVLCSDGACIGIMGLDGRCTQCGKRLR